MTRYFRYRKLFALVLCMAMLFALAGCGGKEAPQAVKESTVEPPQEAAPAAQPSTKAATEEPALPEAPAVYDDSLIGESCSEEGQYSDYEYDIYSLHLPMLKGDTPGIREVNQLIDKLMGGTVRASLEAIQEPDGWPDVTQVGWRSFWQDSLLSLVIEAHYQYEWTDYAVINFDFARDAMLDNEELLHRIGHTMDEFVPAAERAVIRYYDEHYQEYPEATEDFLKMYYSDIFPMRGESMKNVSEAEPLLFLEDGVCKLIAEIYVPAGGGCFRAEVGLEFSVPAASAQNTRDFITAELKDGRVSLTFDDVGLYRGGYIDSVADLQPGVAYEVEGLRNDYTDLLIAPVGASSYDCCLFLLTSSGGLEFVNINECARFGLFCAVPMPGISDVKTLECLESESLSQGSEACSVRAVKKDGTGVDLGLWVSLAGQDPYMETTWYAEGSDGLGYSLSLNGDGTIACDTFLSDNNSLHQEGTLAILGMGDNGGIVCGYTLYGNDDGPFRAGAVTIDMFWNEETFDQELNLTLKTGTSLFDVEPPETIHFIQSFG